MGKLRFSDDSERTPPPRKTQTKCTEKTRKIRKMQKKTRRRAINQAGK
jgi:hypothetical protein